jgi:hypothetical protein
VNLDSANERSQPCLATGRTAKGSWTKLAVRCLGCQFKFPPLSEEDDDDDKFFEGQEVHEKHMLCHAWREEKTELTMPWLLARVCRVLVAKSLAARMDCVRTYLARVVGPTGATSVVCRWTIVTRRLAREKQGRSRFTAMMKFGRSILCVVPCTSSCLVKTSSRLLVETESLSSKSTYRYSGNNESFWTVEQTCRRVVVNRKLLCSCVLLLNAARSLITARCRITNDVRTYSGLSKLRLWRNFMWRVPPDPLFAPFTKSPQRLYTDGTPPLWLPRGEGHAITSSPMLLLRRLLQMLPCV